MTFLGNRENGTGRGALGGRAQQLPLNGNERICYMVGIAHFSVFCRVMLDFVSRGICAYSIMLRSCLQNGCSIVNVESLISTIFARFWRRSILPVFAARRANITALILGCYMLDLVFLNIIAVLNVLSNYIYIYSCTRCLPNSCKIPPRNHKSQKTKKPQAAKAKKPKSREGKSHKKHKANSHRNQEAKSNKS